MMRGVPHYSSFTDLMFSWSLEDIFNENLYKNQVEKIPESFQSVKHYFGSFVFPLWEETRADLASSIEIIHEAPFAEVISLDACKPYGTLHYDIKVDYWRNRFSDLGKDPYKTLPGDVFIVSDAKPETVSDLQEGGRTWTFATVTNITEDETEDEIGGGNNSSTFFKVKALRDIEVKGGMRQSLFVVFLRNITTNKRIWSAIHKFGNLKIIEEVLSADSEVQEDCELCCVHSRYHCSYQLAAEVYARGNYFSESLSVCTKGKLFNMGLQYIQCWKQDARSDNGMMVKRSEEINKIEQQFLESCALNYYELKDNRSMMKFVRAFHSMNSVRNFLKSLDCLDELLVMEEESGNFLEAAKVAELRGDVLRKADLIGKAGHFKEASKLILRYVFSNSLWASGSRGWPLKCFLQKEEILAKAKSFAKKDSDIFYEFVCTEANILSTEQSNLFQLSQYLNASRGNKSLRGEILSIRKILDIHLQLSTSKYDWEYEIVVDLMKHSQESISHNRMSVATLTCFWNLWKEKIAYIFKYLACLETHDADEYYSYGDFCLNYFGVQKRQLNKVNTSFLFLNADAAWVREIDDRFLRRNGKLVSADARHFVSAAQTHWRSELLSVGMKVLETLKALYKFAITNSMSVFCQSMPLVYIFESANSFLPKHASCFLNLSTAYFENVFPLDWRESLTESMISLRGSELSRNVLEEVILENIKGDLTYGQIGRILMIWLGSGKPTDELYKKIAKSFEKNSPWGRFIKELSGNINSEIVQESASGNSCDAPRAVYSVYKFYDALKDTYYNANWRQADYISPSCFLYLIERLLIFASGFQGFLLTTKSSFVEWLICEQSNAVRTANLVTDNRFSMSCIYDFVASIIKDFLYKQQDTAEWIKKSHINFNHYYPLLLLRLMVTLCLLCVNCGTGKYLDLLVDLMGRSDIAKGLPSEFYDVLRGRRHNHVKIDVNVLAEACKKIGNPLVIASLGENCPKFSCPDAIFVDMRVSQSREGIMRLLFSINNKAPRGQTVAVEVDRANHNQGKTSKAPPPNFAAMADHKMNSQNIREGDVQMFFGLFVQISDALMSVENVGDGNVTKFVSSASKLKVEVENGINFVPAALFKAFEKKTWGDEDGKLLVEANCMLDELKQLSSALDMSERELKENISTIAQLLKRLHLRRPRLETFLNQLFVLNNTNADEKEADHSKVEENGKSKMGALAAFFSSNTNADEKEADHSKVEENGKSKMGALTALSIATGAIVLSLFQKKCK